jgi:predicted deacylase
LPGSTTTAATALGMPALLAEVGGQGLWPAGDVDRHAAGLRRTLAMLGLRDGSGDPPAGVQRRLGSDVWLRSGATGFWHPAVAVGDTVHAGERVGEVQDAFGAPLEVVTASTAGVVLFLVTSLAMNAGDPLLALGA